MVGMCVQLTTNNDENCIRTYMCIYLAMYLVVAAPYQHYHNYVTEFAKRVLYTLPILQL